MNVFWQQQQQQQQLQQQLASGLDWTAQQCSNYPTSIPAKEVISNFSRTSPSRVTKPSSAGNSPRSTLRRRTTVTHGSIPYRSMLSERNQYPVDAALLAASLQQRSRPLSWHPSSRYTRYPSTTRVHHPPSVSNNMSAQSQVKPLSAASMYGLVTPFSYYAPGDSSLNGYLTSAVDQPYGGSALSQTLQHTEPDLMQMDPVFWLEDVANVPYIPQQETQYWPEEASAVTQLLPTNQVSWSSQDSLPSPEDISAPATPDIIPAREHTKEPDHSTKVQKPPSQNEELVGVGLYDEPDGLVSLGSTLLGGIHDYQEPIGKGLKLEETFSPAPVDEENGDSDGDDEDAEDDSNEEEDALSEIDDQPSIPSESLHTTLKTSGNSLFLEVAENNNMNPMPPPVQQHMATSSSVLLNISHNAYEYGWI